MARDGRSSDNGGRRVSADDLKRPTRRARRLFERRPAQCSDGAIVVDLCGADRVAAELTNKGVAMAAAVTLQDPDQRIAAIRDNIRELTEQAAAFSGAGDDARAADRIAEQESLLAALLEERASLAG
jgi:hypothetical protein